MSRNTFCLEAVVPFRLDLTAWTLRRRPHNLVDRWDGETYRRTLALSGGGPVEVAVVQTGSAKSPRLQVTVHGNPLRPEGKQAVTVALERLLGHRIDLAAFYRLASRDADLGQLVRRFRGMKPPRFPSVFEGVVNGIACQQLSLTLGIHLLNRLAENHGLSMVANGGACNAFPRPEDLTHATPEKLRPLGFSRQKSRAMIELAQIDAEGHAGLEGLRAFPDPDALARLKQLRGVGRWTAESGSGSVPADPVLWIASARRDSSRRADGDMPSASIKRVICPSVISFSDASDFRASNSSMGRRIDVSTTSTSFRRNQLPPSESREIRVDGVRRLNA